MLNKLIKMLIVMAFSGLILACQYNPPTTHDYDTNYNFSQLKSYAWLSKKKNIKKVDEKNSENSTANNVKDHVTTLDDKRQRKAIDFVLSKKGFVKSVDSNSAEFLIRAHNVSDKKKDVSQFYSIWGYYPYYTPYLWPYQTSNSIEREYEIGTLIVDIIDNKTREVIWQGSISRRMGYYKQQTPEQRMAKAVRSAELMLRSFPPKN